jgi:hypothetical protein
MMLGRKRPLGGERDLLADHSEDRLGGFKVDPETLDADHLGDMGQFGVSIGVEL